MAPLLEQIYYTAIILYLGAEYTRVHMAGNGKKIIPLKFAELVDERMNRKVEKNKARDTPKP